MLNVLFFFLTNMLIPHVSFASHMYKINHLDVYNCYNYPTHLSHSHTLNAPPIIRHKCPIPISPLCLTSHFVCVQFFHMLSIDLPAGVGAPPLNNMQVQIKSVSLAKWGARSILQWIHPKTHDMF